MLESCGTRERRSRIADPRERARPPNRSNRYGTIHSMRNMIMRMHVTFDLRRIRMILRIQSSFHWIEKTFQNGTEFIMKFPRIQNYPLILSGEGSDEYRPGARVPPRYRRKKSSVSITTPKPEGPWRVFWLVAIRNRPLGVRDNVWQLQVCCPTD